MAIPLNSEIKSSLQQERPPKTSGAESKPPILTSQQMQKVEMILANPPQAIAGQEERLRIIELERDAEDNIIKCIILKQERDLQRAFLVKGVLGKGTVGGERVQSVQVLDAIDLSTGKEFAIKEVSLARLGKSERRQGQTATSLSPVVEHEQEALKRADMLEGTGVGLDLVLLTPEQLAQIPDAQILDATARMGGVGDNFSTLTFMEKAQGPNLEDLLYEKVEINGKKMANRRSIDTLAALSMAIGICQRVEDLHMNGVIHRDLKPNNIHLAPDGEIQIIDMGEAYLTNGPVGESKVKETGEIKGTRQYIAPEIEGEESQYSAKTDSYAVGMVFIEIFTDFNVLQRGYELEREGKYKTLDLQGKAVQEEMLKALQARLKNPNLSQEEKELFKHLQKMTSRKSGDRPDLNEDIIVLCNLAMKHLQNNPHATSLFSKSPEMAMSDFKAMKISAQLRQFQQKYPEVLKANREISGNLVGVLMNIHQNDSRQAKVFMNFIDRLENDAKKMEAGVLGFSAKAAKNELRAIIAELKTISFIESQENIRTVTTQNVSAIKQNQPHRTTLRFASDLPEPEKEESRKIVSSPRGSNQNIAPQVNSKDSLAARGQKRRSSILTSYGQIETLKNKSHTTPEDEILKKEKTTSRKFSPD